MGLDPRAMLGDTYFMTQTFIRIFQSAFSLPVWVQIWMFLFLIPVNMSGLFLLNYESGFWVAILGASALAINTCVLFLNRGFSKVLAVPHLILWGPLQVILVLRYFTAQDLSPFEQNYILVVLVVNGISLVFDVFDTLEWKRGQRDVAGFPGEPVKL